MGRNRALRALEIRFEAARSEDKYPMPPHPCNGDDFAFPNKIASYSKALPHNALGEVDVRAYLALLQALKSGVPSDFEAIPLRTRRRGSPSS
jgi:hypothetical protein